MNPNQIKELHVAGNPPGTDPQRSNETYEQYRARMAAAGLPPDISVGESDADYLIRLASYGPTAPLVFITASYALDDDDSGETVLKAATASLGQTITFNTGSATTGSIRYDTGFIYVYMGTAWKSASLA
jgi:hypothetical protein